MSTLVCQTLYTELQQALTLNSPERVHVGAFIPYLYMHGAPAGTFTALLTKDGETIFSKSFDCDDIKTALDTTDDWAHVFFPIIPTSPVQLTNGDYIFKISAAGYTPTNFSFLGWIQQHEDIQNEMEFSPATDDTNGFSIRFKSYKEGIQ